MATKKNPATGRRSSTASRATTSAGMKNDEFNLPAEPEVTRRGSTAAAAGAPSSNPGSEPPQLAAARARRQRAIREEAMRREYAQSQRQSACGSSALSNGLKLIGGAGIGAALMYLLDPEAGERRREEMRERAARAASTSGTVLGNVADIAGNVAGNLWDMTTEAGRAAAHRAGELGSAGAAMASDYGSSLSDRASDASHGFRKGARRQWHSARDTASGWFGHEPKHSYVPSTGTTLSAVTALAAGVGMMYLLDPTDGARRRSLLLDKTRRCLNETGDFFRRTGRHLANRSRGMAHEAQSMFHRDEASDRTVAERIRARLGHLQRPNADVNVAVIDGRATITGCCATDDVDAVLTCVQGTPGVASIVNLLEVQGSGASPQSTTI